MLGGSSVFTLLIDTSSPGTNHGPVIDRLWMRGHHGCHSEDIEHHPGVRPRCPRGAQPARRNRSAAGRAGDDHYAENGSFAEQLPESVTRQTATVIKAADTFWTTLIG